MPAESRHISNRELSPRDLASRSADLMLDKKAREVIIMDLRGLTSVTDFFVVGTGESDMQVKAIVDHLNEEIRSEDTKPFHIEGYDKLSWVLIDYIDVVAHVFLPESRDYYRLEHLWADAKVSEITDSGT
ncbi:MAG: ribosome silencing factor [Fidelibacterota bacterium]|nr:MAG: ribosome silencing factor [Candidatus Neomarinimicrobiota bacterium]